MTEAQIRQRIQELTVLIKDSKAQLVTENPYDAFMNRNLIGYFHLEIERLKLAIE